jgi:hypothetical protein
MASGPGQPGTVDADLGDLLAICRLKYAYVRLLDTKQFDELGQLLTDDVTSAYEGGALAHRGRAAVVSFLRQALGSADLLTMHTVHHPEIELSGTTATGRWYLEDRVLVRSADLVIAGTALYEDRYECGAGGWRISHTGYQRIFEEQRVWSSGVGRELRSRFDPPAAGETR